MEAYSEQVLSNLGIFQPELMTARSSGGLDPQLGGEGCDDRGNVAILCDEGTRGAGPMEGLPRVDVVNWSRKGLGGGCRVWLSCL